MVHARDSLGPNGPCCIALPRALALMAGAVLAGSAAGQRDLAALRGMMPDEVPLVVECERPGVALRALGATLGGLPRDLPAEVLARVAVGLTALQFALGASPAAFADRVAGGGAVVGLLPTAAGVAWLAAAVPEDLEGAAGWCERYPSQVHFATKGEVLLLSSTAAGLERLRSQAQATPSRWATVDFGMGSVGDRSHLVRGAFDLERVRRELGDAAPSVERLDGPGRFVLAPIAHALAAADWLHVGVAAGDQLVIDARALASVRRSTFGGLLGSSEQGAPPPLAAGLAYLSLDRSFVRLLRDVERFLPPASVLAVQGFLSIADALDGAQTSFVDDLLGGLDEPMALYVVPAEAVNDDGEAASPPLVLPGIAIAVRIADAKVEPILFRFAQVFATIANAERTQRGQSAFLIRRRHDERGEGLVAEPPPWRGPGRPPLERALSLTLWCGQGHAILATTEHAAATVLAHIGSAPVAGRGDVLALYGPAIAAALAQNRPTLELARMLDEGEDAVMARRFFDVAIAVARAIWTVVLRCEAGSAHTDLHLTIERAR
ncbi:MAG: hypothetical protein ABIP94_15290 [Planctomycetota bacterium]